MSGLFGVLNVSTQALLVTQAGVRNTSHNIANVNTPGYSRQRQVLGAAPAISHRDGHIGTGVEQLTIERITDRFVQDQLVKQGSLSGSTEAQTTALQLIEQVLNEQTGEGISAALSEFYDAFQDLASSSVPGQPDARGPVREAANSLISTLQLADSQIRDIQLSNDRALVTLLGEINSLTERIQQLNVEIVRMDAMAPANDLRDQREALVRELSTKVDVSTFEDPGGALVVMLSNGLPLVEGASARRLVTQGDPANAFNPTFSKVLFDDGMNQVDVTASIGSGELGGLLAARDVILPGAIRSLDTIAYNLADTVNTQHRVGNDLNGNTGNDFFSALSAVENAAQLLQLDAGIRASTDAIAAGSAAGNGEAGDVGNARLLADLRDSAAPLFLPGDPPGAATGPSLTLLDYAASVTADIGQQTRTMEFSQAQQQRILQGLENRRDEISGVSIDEEVTNLIRLQAAFQANAKVVSTVDRLLQDVLRMI